MGCEPAELLTKFNIDYKIQNIHIFFAFFLLLQSMRKGGGVTILQNLFCLYIPLVCTQQSIYVHIVQTHIDVNMYTHCGDILYLPRACTQQSTHTTRIMFIRKAYYILIHSFSAIIEPQQDNIDDLQLF